MHLYFIQCLRVYFRFLYEEGSPANVFYRNCLAEMRTQFQIEVNTDADAEGDGDDGTYDIFVQLRAIVCTYLFQVPNCNIDTV